jgi:hypothetical protein
MIPFIPLAELDAELIWNCVAPDCAVVKGGFDELDLNDE